MSFAGELKKELCETDVRQSRRAFAECYGMAIASRAFDLDSVQLVTESERVAGRYAKLAKKLCGVTPEISDRVRSDGSKVYSVSITDPGERRKWLGLFGHDGGSGRRIRYENLPDESVIPDFMRGVYLACGSMSDPNKSYHLELAVPFSELSGELAALLGRLLARPKQVRRRGDYVLYYKESENIEDLLTFIGAPKRALEIMEIKVMKDVRNNVNRRTNCETANIDKTVAASARQVADIAFITEKYGMEFLPENLREIARLRLENPEMSLAELGAALDEPISRSGVNHRLERIAAIADELRGKGATD